MTISLSSRQRRLCTLHQQQGFLLPVLHRAVLTGAAVDGDALSQAVRSVAAAHPILRNRFTFQNGQWQAIEEHGLCPDFCTVVDLRELTEAERAGQLSRLEFEEANRRFDIGEGPLARCLLVLTGREQLLWLSAHPLIFDAQSWRAYLRQLERCLNGSVPAFAGDSRARQHEDFAKRQDQLNAGAPFKKKLAWWREYLGTAPADLELPNRLHALPPAAQRVGRHSVVVAEALRRGLRDFSESQGVPEDTVWLTAFACLIHRYCLAETFFIGSPTAGRPSSEWSEVLGPFSDLHLLRVDFPEDGSFLKMVAAVQARREEAREHADVVFSLLAEQFKLGDNGAAAPFLRLRFSHEHMEGGDEFFQCLEPLGFPSVEAFDVFLAVKESKDQTAVSFYYDAGAFEQATIERWVDHFFHLIKAALAEPARAVSAHPLLTEKERHELVVGWNSTAARLPEESSIHGLIQTQAAASPDAVAVVFQDEQLTYGKLEACANQLARYLEKRGVGPDVLVGICVERSWRMLIGLLGILKAGGAYVPLDPNYPEERLSYMLSDAKAGVLVTERGLLERFSDYAGQTVCLDSDWPAIGEESATVLPERSGGEHLAYVIYTSGSTGKPKGVQIPHRAMVNFLASMRRQPGLRAQDILLAVTTLCFDIAGLEMFLPLTAGARVVIAERAVAIHGEQLAALMDRQNVTVMQATPATWRLLLEAGWSGRRQLKILCGGEALPRDLAEQLLTRCGSLWNVYGPTETTVWSTVFPVGSAEGPVSIGKPIANTQTYVVDRGMKPVPLGHAGELLIGGAGVARGYLNRPELTAEKFISGEAVGFPPGRIYRTGDLVRYRRDGDIEFLGRIDHQVKIRGFRIELGEIEAGLGQHPGVKQAVVTALEDGFGGKQLVAYLTSERDEPPAESDLRTHLKTQLPEYMVPSLFVFLKTFPLTPNGKVDRRALPPPERSQTEARRDYVAPRSAGELRLTKIWEKAFGRNSVGVKDNFFELGGHSLVAGRIFAEIQKQFGKNFSPTVLLQNPTVEQLAARLEEASPSVAWTSLVPIQSAGSRPPLFCMHAGAGTVLFYYDLARQLGADQPVYGLQARGLYGQNEPHARVEEMAAAYLEEVRSVQPEGPYYFAGFCFGATLAFEMAQQLSRAGQKVVFLASFDGPTPTFSDAPPPSAKAKEPKPVTRRPSLRSRVARRWQQMQQRKGGKKWRFIFRLLQNRWRAHSFKLKYEIGNYYRKKGRALPGFVRHGYFNWNNFLAEKRYKPKPYTGRMTVFVTQGRFRDPRLGWNKYVEQLEVAQIGGEFHDHRDLMTAKFIQNLMGTLRRGLSEAADQTASFQAKSNLG